MFKPQYRIEIKKECFPPDRVICLGSQLISIIEVLKNNLPPHTWYGADVDALGTGVNKIKFNRYNLTFIGSDAQFSEYCEGVPQFIWGDFVCIDHQHLSKDIESVEIGTEDEEFRPIDCKGILLEIRTFDTSFFEIYSESEEIIKLLSQYFQPVKVAMQPAAFSNI